MKQKALQKMGKPNFGFNRHLSHSKSINGIENKSALVPKSVNQRKRMHNEGPRGTESEENTEKKGKEMTHKKEPVEQTGRGPYRNKRIRCDNNCRYAK